MKLFSVRAEMPSRGDVHAVVDLAAVYGSGIHRTYVRARLTVDHLRVARHYPAREVDRPAMLRVVARSLTDMGAPLVRTDPFR